MIAKRRRVFKVEVVGDCYVAVCGLPDPRADHAVVICKFAMECVKVRVMEALIFQHVSFLNDPLILALGNESVDA